MAIGENRWAWGVALLVAFFCAPLDAQDQLIANNDCETVEAICESEADWTFDNWVWDYSEIVSAENGISPHNGSRMLKFVGAATFSGGNCINPRAAGATTDVLSFSRVSGIPAGTPMVAGAFFNRVAATPNNRFRFEIQITDNNNPTSWPASHNVLATQSGFLNHNNPGNWLEVTHSFNMPAGAETSVFYAYAQDTNGLSFPEFAGHYMDDAYLCVDINTDGTGPIDCFDTDDDGDGVLDVNEYGGGRRFDDDSDNDGWPDYFDTNTPGFTDGNGDNTDDRYDWDGDSIPNHLDPDSGPGCTVNAQCGGATPFCNSGTGECVECVSNGQCDDGNDCTRDRCQSNSCNITNRSSGFNCAGGACDGSGMCVECVDNGDCSGATPFCNTGSNTCVACLNAGHCSDGNDCTDDRCSAGVCNNPSFSSGTNCAGGACDGSGVCVECVDNGDCSGATPFCNTGSNTCVACLNAGHCSDGNECTSDQCSGGVCVNPNRSSGTNCAGGVCNGGGMCVDCVSDAQCGGLTPRCQLGSNTCVECLSAAQCDDSNPCTSNACSGNTCRFDNLPLNTSCGGALVCDGMGLCQGCNDDAQCDDGNECTRNQCTAGVCAFPDLAAGTSCSGMRVCSGMGECVECLSDAQCVGDQRCDLGLRRCVECLNANDCGDGNECTADICGGGGVCSNPNHNEGTSCGLLAECDDMGMCASLDSDRDGVIDASDADDDNDGIPDVHEIGTDLSIDADGDGIVDYRDASVVACDDANRDGECDQLLDSLDLDGDGVPNHLDLDSDGDGIFDLIESTSNNDVDDDGRVDDLVDEDSDGLMASVDADDRNATVIERIGSAHDSDRDGIPDFLELDSDDDGRADRDECASSPCTDSDENGAANYQDADDDGDSILTRQEDNDTATHGNPDDDGVDAFLDLDSDGDGAPDAFEAGWDLDRDNIPDYLDPDSMPDDSDGDGIPDLVECRVQNACEDTDGDGTPDYLDLDSDDDGVDDEEECPHPQSCRDSDSDGLVDFRDIDSDGDGIIDGRECIRGACDADGDGIPNYLEEDSDGDGYVDLIEGHDEDFDRHADRNPSGLDMNGNGLDDAFDPDAGGVEAPLSDWDNDGLPEFVDTDDDGNGTPTIFCADMHCPTVMLDGGMTGGVDARPELGSPAGGFGCAASRANTTSFWWLAFFVMAYVRRRGRR